MLVLLFASGWGWRALADQARAAQGRLQEATRLEQQAAAIADALPKGKPGARPLRSLDRELADVILHIERARAANQIEISSLASSKAGVAREAQPLQGLADPLPQTDGAVRGMTLKLKGSYRQYAGLQRFLASFAPYPVALRRLKVTEEAMEADLFIIGGAG
ncbi:hypothetical protein BUE93_20370 [Chromobacterium amazonense]|uniref:General secretion pathway protein GspM n=1 Tax=Chromobacterium amazonense TaxID=1382803 RepID=A0A2S9WZB4_9NEIS|nr:hypothetical protein BUE93_20370 [Chromobacterium amazonense]